MKKQHFFPTLIVIALILALAAPSAWALEDPEHSAYAVVLADANTGSILYEQNPDTRLYPASTTKIMTVLLAVEALERGEAAINDKLTTSADALADMIDDGSSIGLVEGEELAYEDLLYAAMVGSANDACNVLAEYLAGSVSGFVQLMNDRALELGMTNTHFNNTHGLPDENHYTTAYDMFLLTREAMTHTRFVELCNTVEKAIPATNFQDAQTIHTTNSMMDPTSDNYYEYVSGVKTGRTDAAGFCLVSTAMKDDVALMAVVMGVERDKPISEAETNHFAETRKIYEWAFENFSYQEILLTSEPVTRTPVAMAENVENVVLRPAEAVTALVPSDFSTSDVERDITVYSEESGEELVAPLSEGDVLGEVTLHYNGNTFGPVALVAAGDVQLSRVEYMRNELTSTFDNLWVRVGIIALIALVALYIIYVIVHAARKRRKRKQRLGKK